MAYVVKTHVFEGPLHLLLDLIEKRKLLINDISLSTVADDFLEHIKELPELPLDETAEFVAMAATLLLMKSRSLLPSMILTDEEAHDVATLERRLALLALIRECMGPLSKQFAATPLYEAPQRRGEPVFAPDALTTLDGLRSAIESVLLSFPIPKVLPKTAVKKVISLEEMIMRLTERVSREMRMSFKQFAAQGRDGKAEKGDIIVSFLALLELVKQGIIRASQEEEHGDITLETDSVHTPSYG